ncbi:serine/threonine-protein phosphatase PGAM5, mitochondrial isoform X3 [Lingula anatina]|uniref:Serine/threonine-protein phosphatase PGAM5, mitochondrial n=1 Tax=Lingula anatina TaxID=7574 RepID=A0A1S3J2P7_LINAN|nr:serine/threonine-protein phosphatase PGAM5, mitochondrial isoform X3 [Lingula anatina]XP_023933124.1 serine/threonine-protein phosphatase PGAM5, mitochondrial isoform X3 [Lingula anatina]XP_023933126.1 serine/threonine-protein phosphatase PGAM5, mitochondrial isoform X3 [Lingula anatina]XP_023933128.1 serine/threonine-protein phosphatase PGAM5, mitochondrial isoform X3 [Lingula anatina]XP_023933129.1 serine/threonine-protein phosphatase PGAM5, mitochondrial isoform X3 [Lingula anatina]|eukprot:XP_013404680.1 serine/threonine-protein phosphatase PGAM5, mitochondrial isoform X3 [Lingula anatina]
MAGKNKVTRLVQVVAGFGAAAAGGWVISRYMFKDKTKHAPGHADQLETPKKWDYNWDKREPKSMVRPPKSEKDQKEYENNLEKAKPTASRHLLFIRHGQYNLKGEKDEDRILTDLGRKQAALVGQRLKELDLPYSLLVYSTMARATETGKIVQKFLPPDIPVNTCSFIREGAPIQPEPPVGHWRPEQSQFFEDGARIEAAFRKYFHRAKPSQEKDSYEVYVCHANVIRYFVCRALQFPPEAWLRLTLHNCSITWLTIRPSGRVSLKGLGDSGHLPPDCLTTN